MFVLLNRDNDKVRINSLQFVTVGMSGLILICTNTHTDPYINIYACLYAYLCREIKRKNESKKFYTFQAILHSAPGNTWPAPSLCSELWPGVIPHLSAPWLILSSSLGNRDISAIELSASARWSSSCQAQHSSVRQWAVSPVVPRLSHRAKARQQEQEFEPRTECRGQAPAPVAALSWGAWAACLGWLLVPSWWQCLFSSSDALVPPFTPFWDRTASDRFSPCVWQGWRNRGSFYKSSFALQSLLKQHPSKPAGCQPQACGWQICHVMSDLPWETLPPTVPVLERVVHWLGSQDSCLPSDLYQSKPHTNVPWQQLLFYLEVPWKIRQGHFWKISHLQ